MRDLEFYKASAFNPANLLQDATRYSYGARDRKQPRNKKRIQRKAEPHLEPRKHGKHTYYVYRRGIDPPIYLGSADHILSKVKGK